MQKDPLNPIETAYDVFLAAFEAAGRTDDLRLLKPRDFRQAFSFVRAEYGAAAAAEFLAEVTRPQRRLALDLWHYYWFEQPAHDTTARNEPPDPLKALREALRQCCSPDEIDIPRWTDLDRSDWSNDFCPMRPLPNLKEALDSDRAEIDPREILEPPEPGY